MISSDFKFQKFYLSEIDSTNSYALEELKANNAKEGHVFYTFNQKRGKGQQGNVWQSERGKNLLFSLLVKPKVQVENQFVISQCVALGLKYYLDSLAVGKVEIKWPNDILVNQRKVAGILIENVLEGRLIANSIIGVGLNVNQNTFPIFNRVATSIKSLTGESYDLEKELNLLLGSLQRAFEEYRRYGVSYVKTHYLESLYGYNKPLQLQDNQGTFKGKIADIENSGLLRVWRNGKLCLFDLKELVFID